MRPLKYGFKVTVFALAGNTIIRYNSDRQLLYVCDSNVIELKLSLKPIHNA